MKKIACFSLIFMLLLGCNNETHKKPKNLIERQKMVNILYDISILEAMKVENPAMMDSVKGTSNQYIFKKYKIDSIQFAKSNTFYATDLDEYEKMYTEVKARIDSNKTKITALIKLEVDKKNKEAKQKQKKINHKVHKESTKVAK